MTSRAATSPHSPSKPSPARRRTSQLFFHHDVFHNSFRPFAGETFARTEGYGPAPARVTLLSKTLSEFPTSDDILLKMSDTAATDLQLLARYANSHAEDAFAELVSRHLVSSIPPRSGRSAPTTGREVAQSVFTDLARNATKLSSGSDASSPDSLTPALPSHLPHRH